MARVNTRNRRVQSPVPCCMNCSGSGMMSWRRNGTIMPAKGPRHTRNKAALVHLLVRTLVARWVGTQHSRLVVLAQIHARVEAGDLIAVAVKHQGLVRFKEVGQAALASLAPARMIDRGVNIGIEAVFLRGRHIPGCRRLIFDKTDLNERLGTLESIFPWDDQAHRGAILVGQSFTVHADAEKR